MNRRTILASAATLAISAGALPVQAQSEFPTKTIRIVVSVAAGGATDLAARRVSEKMGQYLGQPVIVENRPGAGTVLGLRAVLAAPADGYTIAAHSSTLNMLQHTVKDLGFDSRTDFTPVGIMGLQSSVVSVGGKQAYETIHDLIKDAKARPGQLTFSHGGTAGPQYIIMQTLNGTTGIEMQPVQYQGVGASFVDVAAGRVTVTASGYSGQAGFIPDRQLKPLAVTGDTRIAALPDVPTLKEQGIDMTASTWLGLLVHKDVPETRINRLSEALKFALDDPQLREQALREGSDPTFLTPAQTRELLAREAKVFDELAAKFHFTAQ